MSGIQDKLGDLSWLGDAYADQGWFVVGDAPAAFVASEADLAWERAKSLLRDSDWSMLPDVPMLASEKDLWIVYRRALRDIRSQAGFPVGITWPVKPA